jgi:hypothetical protein
VILNGNIFRTIAMVAAAFTGYYLFGFMGFAYGTALSAFPPLAYYLWLQRKKGMLITKYEAYKVAFVLSVAASAYLAGRLVLLLWQIARKQL